PERFKSKTFENYKPVCAAAVDNAELCNAYAASFDQRRAAGGGLVLCGKPGTGKTHLATAIANHAMREFKMTTIFSSVMSAMRRVKSTYSRDSQETEHEAVEIYTLPDLLVLDEVGVQFGTDAEKLILFEIVNVRYQDMKPTILISNLNVNALKDYIGERVLDRMREGGGAVLAFDWESYRGQL
nr:ATP-binding protein [Gammaproteobacteria bacterium]